MSINFTLLPLLDSVIPPHIMCCYTTLWNIWHCF